MIPAAELDYMADYAKRAYGKGEIDRAGQCLIEWWNSPDATLYHEPYSKAFFVVENWRTSHNYPLVVFQKVLRLRAKQVDPNAIVAKRLKRFFSLMNKLLREPQMKLSQMHDLGGCRAIVTDVAAVYRLYETYLQKDLSSPPMWTIKCYDYIENPKPDGYRGIHVVGRYVARNEISKPWDGYRIEIQLRSRLQHAFATAVETVTTFTGTPLKFGGGLPDWKRLFSLMGSVLAIREGTKRIEGTPDSEKQLVGELRKLVKRLRVRQRLRGWTRALRKLPRKNIETYKWLLISLDISNNTVKVTGFSESKEAASAIADIEKLRYENIDAVLVWVDSVTELQEAYPNYYADTREFLKAMNLAISSKGRRGQEAFTL